MENRNMFLVQPHQKKKLKQYSIPKKHYHDKKKKTKTTNTSLRMDKLDSERSTYLSHRYTMDPMDRRSITESSSRANESKLSTIHTKLQQQYDETSTQLEQRETFHNYVREKVIRNEENLKILY